MNILSLDLPGSLIVIVVAGLAWFVWDMNSILKAGQRKNQLSIEGRWKDLEKHFERTSKSYRPFVWLYDRYLLPGSITTQHALFLFNQGRLEEALTKVDQAIRQIANKPKLFRSIHRKETLGTLGGALRTRTLILTGLGRYEEARQVAAQLQQLTGSDANSNTALALLELYCGHFDAVLAQAQAVPPHDPQYDAMQNISALACSMKGDFDAAIQALLVEPGDVTKFYAPEKLEALTSSSTGAKLLELQRKKHAGVSQPARLLALAGVYLAREEFEIAARALDQAEKTLGPEPGIQGPYCRYRACSLAGQGKADEAGTYIERARVIAAQRPARSTRRETHLATGQSYFYLRRFNDAIAELAKAQELDLHPVEKHVTTWWFARTHEAAGHQREAIPYYKAVAADPIPSWMRQRAAEALARQTS